jgi:hypothetical protein
MWKPQPRYGDGRRAFIIYLIESMPRLSGGNPDTSTLMSAIVMAARFRFLFLEDGSLYNWTSYAVLSDEVFVSRVRQMFNDIDRVLSDAKQEGLDDEACLVRADPRSC